MLVSCIERASSIAIESEINMNPAVLPKKVDLPVGHQPYVWRNSQLGKGRYELLCIVKSLISGPFTSRIYMGLA